MPSHAQAVVALEHYPRLRVILAQMLIVSGQARPSPQRLGKYIPQVHYVSRYIVSWERLFSFTFWGVQPLVSCTAFLFKETFHVDGYQFYWIRLRSAPTLSMNISISRFWVMHVFYHSLIIWSSWTKHITLHAATVLVLVIKSVLSHRVCTFSPGLRVSGEPSVAEFANRFFLYKASRVRPHRVKPNRADHCHSGQDHTGSGYTGPSIQSIKDGPASIRHQGPSIQSIEGGPTSWHLVHQSIKGLLYHSSKHQIIKASNIKGLLYKTSRVDPQTDTLCFPVLWLKSQYFQILEEASSSLTTP